MDADEGVHVIRRLLTTWHDVSRHGKRKMATTQTGSRNNFWTEIDGDAISAAAPKFSTMPTQICHWRHGPRSPDIGCFHFRFVSPPFYVPDVGRRPGHVDRGISTSGIVENVGIAIDISLLSHASPEIQCTSGLNAAILFPGCRRMSVNVDDGTAELCMVENMGVAVGISLITCPEK